jgi:hypothetical protein
VANNRKIECMDDIGYQFDIHGDRIERNFYWAKAAERFSNQSFINKMRCRVWKSIAEDLVKSITLISGDPTSPETGRMVTEALSRYERALKMEDEQYGNHPK